MIALVLGPLLAACRPPQSPTPPEVPRFTVLSVNDTYRIEGQPETGVGGLARLRTLRSTVEAEPQPVLVLHGGDLLYPSLLSRSYGGEQMIDVMNRLDGDPDAFDPRLFAVFGNHEFDKRAAKDAPKLDARVDQSQFTWLSSNVNFATDATGAPVVGSDHLVSHAIVDLDGVKVGLLGVTVPDKIPEYVTSFDDPLETVRSEVATLRADGAAYVIAVTHLPEAADRRILELLALPAGPDLIVGGHDHQAMIVRWDERLVVKGDADAVSAVRVDVFARGEGYEARAVGVPLGPGSPAPDPALQAVVDEWISRHEREFCAKAALADGCLDEVLGTTSVPLSAEELRIRRFETNTGDWLADLARAAHAEQGVQVALLNSGSIRLNHDVPAGPITRRNVEELLPYPTVLEVVDIPGAVLRDQVLRHSVDDWTGVGSFLQVSGLGFTHDVENHGIRSVWIADGAGRRPLRDDETVRVVTTDYLMDPTLGNRDGYDMIDVSWGRGGEVALKDLVLRALKDAPGGAIAPVADGRICTTSESTCP